MLPIRRLGSTKTLLIRRCLGTTNVPHPPTAAATEVASLMERAKKAQSQIEHYTQDQVNDLLRAMVSRDT